MDKITVDGPKMPIGFLASLWKGIEYVNAHPGILIFPVLLDAFLWFGPHLTIVNVMRTVFDWMASQAAADPNALTIITAAVQSLEKFNLFSLLSFIPLYPPSVLAATSPFQTPLGNPIVVPIGNGYLFLILLAGLPFISLLFGSVYWVFIGRAVKNGHWSIRDYLARWIRTVAVVVLLCVSFLVVILAFGFPILFLIWMIAGISPDIGGILAQAFIILGRSLVFWLVLFVMFSVHGTILFGDGVLGAIWNSLNTSRWLYPLSIWIPLLLIMLYFVSSSIWSLAPADNWAGAIGILGNAYTGSVVVSASMAYYIDKRRWIDEVKTYLQSRMAETLPPVT